MCCAWFSVLFMCILCSANGFNLETRIPVIKTGKTESYFGFSIAEHITSSSDYGDISWLLVGAPLDKNLQPNTTRSGALWKCPLTTHIDDCQQVITDGRKDVDSEKLRPPLLNEVKDGQWLGVTVRSQGKGGMVAVCAHRYIHKDVQTGESEFGQGLCYVLDQELDFHMASEPCKGETSVNEYKDFTYCQAGTSGYLMEDNTFLVGTPGPFTWTGTLFVIDTGPFLSRAHPYRSRVTGAAPVSHYSYLGMSAVGGKFLSDSNSYISGAPRSKGHGEVIFFSKPQNIWNESLISVTLTLKGEQIGSNFGYELATADVNGDGHLDLLVGAPFYFERDIGGAVYLYMNKMKHIHNDYDVKLTGRAESQFGIAITNAGDLNRDGCEDIAIGSPYEGDGVVYIYLGNRETGLERTAKQVIRAETLPVQMKTFGYSLSGGLDLDGNLYPDLAVGAYESSKAVILRTRPIIDIRTYIRPSKELKSIDPSKRGCVNDPLANYTCFHFEACCKIHSPVKSRTANKHKLRYTIEAETFKGRKKFSRVFFGLTDSSRTNIINRTIEVSEDREDCREHIVYVKDNSRDIQSPIAFELNYSLDQSTPVYRGAGDLENLDKYPVLNATARYSFTAEFLNDCGVDNICISDLQVDVDLDLPKSDKSDEYMVTLGQEDEIRIQVKPDNLGESAYNAHLLVRHDPSLHYIAANVTNKHIICTIENSTLIVCTLGNPFKRQIPIPSLITLRFDPRGLEDHQLSVDFDVWMNSTSQEKNPDRKPVRVSASIVKNAELSIKGIARPEQVFYGGSVKGESAMKYLDDIGARVIHVYQVFNEGPWHVRSVSLTVEWPHQVASNQPEGKWLLYLDALPTVEAQGGGQCFVSPKYINPLNVERRPEEPENLRLEPDLFHGTKWSTSSVVERSEYNHTRSGTYVNQVRRKRDLEEDDQILKAEAFTDKDGHRHQIVNMNCQNQTAKCIRFNCMIYRLARNQAATVTITARLWNTTLVEDYPRVGHVRIASTAHLSIPEHYNIRQHDIDDDYTTVETVAYPDLVATELKGIPIWVVIISVLAGLILLVLLILALWKFGFFKRSRPDPTLSGNLEKNHEASPFLVSNRTSLQ